MRRPASGTYGGDGTVPEVVAEGVKVARVGER